MQLVLRNVEETCERRTEIQDSLKSKVAWRLTCYESVSKDKNLEFKQITTGSYFEIPHPISLTSLFKGILKEFWFGKCVTSLPKGFLSSGAWLRSPGFHLWWGRYSLEVVTWVVEPLSAHDSVKSKLWSISRFELQLTNDSWSRSAIMGLVTVTGELWTRFKGPGKGRQRCSGGGDSWYLRPALFNQGLSVETETASFTRLSNHLSSLSTTWTSSSSYECFVLQVSWYWLSDMFHLIGFFSFSHVSISWRTEPT